ncbi:hypothetical protein Cgig2_017206 [Carnegiea gigantea]|uniref:UBA domain-containing protein n=1 Tax=Carnegiea gigantea TaxID=171969 RepID=A0A9Q1KH18_9CARY|nr:hypothetical protein Cgig2_017206 [Carnegiea gigantea]
MNDGKFYDRLVTDNAPVTGAIIIACALFTVFFGIQGRSDKLGLSFQNLQDSDNEAITLIILFKGVYFQHPKRKMSKKLNGDRLALSNPSNALGCFPEASALEDHCLNVCFYIDTGAVVWTVPALLFPYPSAVITSGPYGLVFASFVPFFFDIPVSTRFRVVGVHFSNKTFIYLAGLQLPDFIASLFSWLSWPSMDRSPSAPRTRNVTNYPSPFAGSVEPSEDSIAMLVSMGFDRDSARQALVQARNDINVATNILLESQSY